MRIVYEAYAGGDITIDDSDLAGKTKDEIDIYINTIVGETVAEEASDNATWEIDEE